MAVLYANNYDPQGAASVTKSTAAALAMTALDTSNLRATITAPTNGAVLVRIKVAQKGTGNNPSILLGVLDGATVRGRAAPLAGRTALHVYEALFLVTGLTPGNIYNLDAAYGVETGVSTTTIGWGGPNNNTTANDAYGAITYEITDTPDLLAGLNYDPAAAVTKSTAALLAMTAIDTTNCRLAIPAAPASGDVLINIRVNVHGSATQAVPLLGILEGSTIRARVAGQGGNQNISTSAATDFIVFEATFIIRGLTGGQAYNFDVAYGVEAIAASSGIKYGGPNDATADNAFGGLSASAWAA